MLLLVSMLMLLGMGMQVFAVYIVADVGVYFAVNTLMVWVMFDLICMLMVLVMRNVGVYCYVHTAAYVVYAGCYDDGTAGVGAVVYVDVDVDVDIAGGVGVDVGWNTDVDVTADARGHVHDNVDVVV